jgi:hypothetical protein
VDADFRPVDDRLSIPAKCLFTAAVTAASVAAVRKLLNPKHILDHGCRVIKHPNACARCVANNDCTKIPLHPHCRCKPEMYLTIENE